MFTRLAFGRLGVFAGGRLVALLLGLLSGGQVLAQAPAPNQAVSDSANVVLVTIDGLRWQELFGGADAGLVRRETASQTLRSRYVRPTAEARRHALLPFLWDSVGRRGQLFGNRKLGNFQDVTNGRRVSYPGYNELLTGAADDEHIRGNRGIPNPNQTVLEVLNYQPAFAGRVATFASWEMFPLILNQARSGLPVDAGLAGEERADSLTYLAARRYLVQAHPRVLYLAFGNTDTFAHHGHYGQYLNAANAIDGYLAELWALLQSLPQYRGHTTLLVTTDHGRGRGRFWTMHGREFRASAHTWLAVLGPGVGGCGEVRESGQHYQSQVAGLIAHSLGVPFPAPAPVVVPPAAVATTAAGE